MKKQTFLAGAIAALFVLTAAGTVLGGDRRGPHRGQGHWDGRHSAAKPHDGHWQRKHTHRHHRGWWNDSHPDLRHRMHHRASDHHPGFHAPGHRAGHYPGDRHGWHPGPSHDHQRGDWGRRPSDGRHHGQQPAGAAYGRSADGRGDGGFDRHRTGIDRSDRPDRGGDDGAVASDDTASRRGGRQASGRQRQL